jgi:hypothetical protein
MSLLILWNLDITCFFLSCIAGYPTDPLVKYACCKYVLPCLVVAVSSLLRGLGFPSRYRAYEASTTSRSVLGRIVY